MQLRIGGQLLEYIRRQTGYNYSMATVYKLLKAEKPHIDRVSEKVRFVDSAEIDRILKRRREKS